MNTEMNMKRLSDREMENLDGGIVCLAFSLAFGLVGALTCYLMLTPAHPAYREAGPAVPMRL